MAPACKAWASLGSTLRFNTPRTSSTRASHTMPARGCKNRPTRMIPRAEVYTSSDVTVEELRGEGDEPALTPEALAKRIGEGRSEIEDL